MAVVERTWSTRRARAKLAEAYLNSSTRDEGQEIAAKHRIRPRSPAVLKKYASDLQAVQAVHRRGAVRRLAEAQKVHFNDGGQFDQIYTSVPDMSGCCTAPRPRQRLRPRACEAAQQRAAGFGLTLGYTLLYLCLIVLIPLSALFLKTFTHDLGAVLGGGQRRRACWPRTG